MKPPAPVTLILSFLLGQYCSQRTWARGMWHWKGMVCLQLDNGRPQRLETVPRQPHAYTSFAPRPRTCTMHSKRIFFQEKKRLQATGAWAFVWAGKGDDASSPRTPRSIAGGRLSCADEGHRRQRSGPHAQAQHVALEKNAGEGSSLTGSKGNLASAEEAS